MTLTYASDLITRRRFLEFLGRGSLALAAASPFTGLGLLSSCTKKAKKGARGTSLSFRPIEPIRDDKVHFSDGFRYTIIAKTGDAINARGDPFGTDCDFTAFIPLKSTDPNDGFLWVNHENFSPPTIGRPRVQPGEVRTKEEVAYEQGLVGGSILHIRRDDEGKWKLVPYDVQSRRISAKTRIPFSGGHRIAGSREAVGTLANCAGGVTPWRTFLTCEENYEYFYGEREFGPDGKPTKNIVQSKYPHGWETAYAYPPEHYGWVVEVNPRSGSAKKLVSLGRFSHEGATVVQARDGRPVVYMGDDAEGHCLYKFISDQKGNLDQGTLYVANLERGRWIPLDLERTPILKKRFSSQLEIQTYTHAAAVLAGGTPLDRPEDIERDPFTGALYLSLTNNTAANNHHGSILKILEYGSDPLSLKFEPSTFLTGGPDSGFACPDNLAFDEHGNLWMCTDMPGARMGGAPYTPFGNNGIFYIPLHGPDAGAAFQIASAPMDAEFTGLSFSPDGKTLFVSVQHPGEASPSPSKLTSHWPEGSNSAPKSAVLAVSGPILNS